MTMYKYFTLFLRNYLVRTFKPGNDLCFLYPRLISNMTEINNWCTNLKDKQLNRTQ
jgi:hypothetical protein